MSDENPKTPAPAKHIASKSFVDRMTSGMADPDAWKDDEITPEERRIFGLPPADADDKTGKT